MSTYERALRAKNEELQEAGRAMTVSQIFSCCKSQLPESLSHKPWTYVNHGVDLLSTDNQLNAYIAAYGEMHEMKCLAAFQKFNFKKLDDKFEIIDWGCGQGIGSLVLLELLKEHEKDSLLQKITLIEPSDAALRRAVFNVKILNDNINIATLCKYLPGNGSHDEVDNLSYSCNTVIHIFSNILDIDTVNLPALAQLIADKDRTHYVMCMGPMNTNHYRIHEFANMFPNTRKISLIDEGKFGYTKSTHHVLSCCTDCFEYNGSGINLKPEKLQPVLIGQQPVFDDYDDNMLLNNHVLTQNEFELYVKLKEGLAYDDSIFIKPNIGGDKPLMVIIRPGIGVLLVTAHKPENSSSIAIETIKSYQRNLIEVHVKDLLAKSLVNTSYWAVIHKMIYIIGGSIEQFEKKYSEEKELDFDKKLTAKELSYTHLVDKDTLRRKTSEELIHELRMSNQNNLFMPMIYKNFMRAISGNWHSFKSGVEITPSHEQVVLMESKATKQKINGVAGSGKTQVLCERAVNAQLRTGGKILILSYNITLTNYLQMRLDNVRKDFSWDMFEFMNYHQFFNAQALNHGIKVRNLDSYDDLNYFNEVSSEIERYAAIFIDEVQDYKTEWLEILQKYFLMPQGEFVVFGDSKQNIYERPLDVNGDIKLGTIGGVWNNSLAKSYRFVNQDLVFLANHFQEKFYDAHLVSPIGIQMELSFEKNLYYYHLPKNTSATRLYEKCQEIMDQYAEEHPDEDTRTTFTILSQTVKVLRDIDTNYCKNKGKNKTMTTFESQKQYDELKNASISFEDALKEVRASKKRHFKCGSALIKLSTIHSFKGWESKNVILILLPEATSSSGLEYYVSKDEDEKELIYTGITRAKEKLYVIDLDNQRYGDFFREECK